ncbi:hypothetical protein [Metaclostridioides mangenotii]|nr:hypothetical protein [Clostridioides mangenotii]
MDLEIDIYNYEITDIRYIGCTGGFDMDVEMLYDNREQKFVIDIDVG